MFTRAHSLISFWHWQFSDPHKVNKVPTHYFSRDFIFVNKNISSYF